MEVNEVKYSSVIHTANGEDNLSPHQKPFLSSTMHRHVNMHQEIPNFSHSTSALARPNNSTDITSTLFFNSNGVFSPNTSSLTNSLSSNFDTNPSRVDHIQVGIVNERRLRRMISNRESARRSRLRKKKQIEELQFQVDHLRAANNHLSEKLIALLESNHQILQENAQLKEKVSSLQVIVSDLISPFRNNLQEDLISNSMDHLKTETSSRSNRQ